MLLTNTVFSAAVKNYNDIFENQQIRQDALIIHYPDHQRFKLRQIPKVEPVLYKLENEKTIKHEYTDEEKKILFEASKKLN